MRLRYLVMDWIGEQNWIRIPIQALCVIAVVTLVGRCCGVEAKSPNTGETPVLRGEFVCVAGDADGNGLVTMGDVVALINYIFAGGTVSEPWHCGQSFFLFDAQVSQVAETFVDDTDWVWGTIGLMKFYPGSGIRRVKSYSLPDSQPTWYWLVPAQVWRDSVGVVEVDTSRDVTVMSRIWSPDLRLFRMDSVDVVDTVDKN